MLNSLIWIYMYYNIIYNKTGGFALGTWLAFLISLLNATAYIVKKCIYDKGSKTKER